MLRGASAEAEAQLTSDLEGSTGEVGKLGEELFGVAAVLRAEAALRRIFTDASIDSSAKADLAGNVFGNEHNRVIVAADFDGEAVAKVP